MFMCGLTLRESEAEKLSFVKGSHLTALSVESIVRPSRSTVFVYLNTMCLQIHFWLCNPQKLCIRVIRHRGLCL
jgi:hypothetical protein